MSDTTVQVLTPVFLVWSYKLAVLVLGYLFAYLGYKLLVKGITGEFKFQSEIRGAKADLISASPGLFFILMAAAIVSVALYRGFQTEVGPAKPAVTSPTPPPTVKPPSLPATPPAPGTSSERGKP